MKDGLKKDKTIRNAFVLVSPDCPVEHAIEPTAKPGSKPTLHGIQYRLLTERPYYYDLDELILETHIRHKLPEERVDEARRAEIREALFRKSHPCMRASALPKKYGYGVHYDANGKIALFPMESETYRSFAESGREGVKVEYAMRNKKT